MDSKRTPSKNPLHKGIEFIKLQHFHGAYHAFDGIIGTAGKDSLNYAIAHLYIGLMHLNGWGMRKHKEAAKEFLKVFKDFIAPRLSDPDTLNNLLLVNCLAQLRFYDEDFSAPKTAAEYYQIAAAMGDFDALASLGSCYEEEKGVPKNISVAKDSYLLAAQQNSVIGQYRLACYYLDKSRILENEKEGEEWLIKAVRQRSMAAATLYGRRLMDKGEETEALKLFAMGQLQNFGSAIHELGRYCRDGGQDLQKSPPAPEAAFYHFSKAVECGHDRSNWELGYLSYKLRNQKAGLYFEEAAKAGIPRGWFEAAQCYKYGLHGVKKNMAKAFEYYMLAAITRDEEAIEAIRFVWGIHVNPKTMNRKWIANTQYEMAIELLKSEEDLYEAILFLEGAVLWGHVSATVELGRCYLKGIGVEKDLGKAINYLKKVADKSPMAMLQLGKCYFKAKGIPKAASEAVKCFQKIAEINPEAMARLGICYLLGEGVEKDPAMAVHCLVQAAEKDFALAQYSLAVYFDRGKEGIEPNLKEAIYWYSRDASQGGVKSRLRFKQLLGFEYESYEKIVGKPKKRETKQEATAKPSSERSDAKLIRPEASLLSSSRGDAASIFEFGQNHLHGRGVPVDKIAALSYFIEATLLGNMQAQHALEKMGDKEITRWHKAALGDPEAQFAVAEFYKSQKSKELADNWYIKAAQQEYPPAKKVVRELGFSQATAMRGEAAAAAHSEETELSGMATMARHTRLLSAKPAASSSDSFVDNSREYLSPREASDGAESFEMVTMYSQG